MKHLYGFLALVFLFLCGHPALGQKIYKETFKKDKINGWFTYSVNSENSIYLIDIYNEGDSDFQVEVDGNDKGIIPAKHGNKFGVECKIYARVICNSGGHTFWSYSRRQKDIEAAWLKEHPKETQPEVTRKIESPVEQPKPTPPSTEIKPAPVENKPITNTSAVTAEKKKETVSTLAVNREFEKYLSGDEYYSEAALNSLRSVVDSFCNALKAGADSTSVSAKHFLQNRKSDLEKHREDKGLVVYGFLNRYNDKEIKPSQEECVKKMTDALDKRLGQRQATLDNLQGALSASNEKPAKQFEDWVKKSAIAGTVLLLLMLVLFFSIRWRKRTKVSVVGASATAPDSDNAEAGIVVRRATSNILKKQSLADVMNNDAYLPIDCKDFCSDSAVSRIYLKNTCIKEIYDMYANDLRNPANPKEDGCMVLGRWVEDITTGEYCVSLEQVVLPGDDAVFKEYELNFGGKIKMRVADCLRKLRRETDLQYDLTCWVHSHPGLGVFFSNFDDAVHKQLKHHSHPKFLTAMVVDILTPSMETGIFTFKKTDDLVVNAKADITKLYSLEEMYKWAMESIRSSHNPDDYFDAFSAARYHSSSCNKVMLSNGAIIDICQCIDSLSSNTVKWACGFSRETGKGLEYFVDKVTDIAGGGEERLGCFLTGTHFSIPSIRKALGEQQSHVKFVLFYSSADATLVSMPVIDGSLLMDERYYSRQKMEDLKIWTRRKR